MTRANNWYIKFGNPTQPKMKWICFHYAGGSPTVFRTWAQHLPDVEVLAVELPGRGARFSEPLIRRMGVLQEAMVPSLASVASGDFAVIGYSLGALVGFEWVRNLMKTGQTLPKHFVSIGRAAPHLQLNRSSVYGLPENEFIQKMNTFYGALPKVILDDPEMRTTFLPIVIADMELYETYVCEKGDPLPVPITAIGGTEDPFLTEERLQLWSEHTNRGCQIRQFPGGHFVMQTKEKEILSYINSRIFS